MGLTADQLNFSSSTCSADVAPCRSACRRAAANCCSSGVKYFAVDGVFGRKKNAAIATRTVIAPSMKKIHGQPL